MNRQNNVSTKKQKKQKKNKVSSEKSVPNTAIRIFALILDIHIYQPKKHQSMLELKKISNIMFERNFVATATVSFIFFFSAI